MSHAAQPPSVENPIMLVVTGDRAIAVVLEEALRRYFAAGLDRLAATGSDDPGTARRALHALGDCARVTFNRYNERYAR